VVADGAVVKPGFSGQGSLAFSADGSRWAAMGVGPAGANGALGPLVVLIDGREAGRYRDASLPSFSPDARHVAYLAENDDGRIVLIVDGRVQTTFPPPATPCAAAAAQTATRPGLFSQHAVRYLADGSLLIATRDADGWGVYRDATRIASYPLSTTDSGDEKTCPPGPWLLVESLRTATAEPVAVWWERLPGTDPRWRVMRDGRPLDDIVCHGFLDTQPPELDEEGRHLAYGCVFYERPSGTGQLEPRIFVVREGVREGPYQKVWGIAFSEDGEHLAYGAADLGDDERPWSYYVDGQRQPGRWASVWRPRLTAGARHLAWEAQHDPDGPGVLGLDRWRLGTFDEVLWGPTFEGDRVAWIIRRERRLTRVELPLR
jgi:hypothetical protein